MSSFNKFTYHFDRTDAYELYDPGFETIEKRGSISDSSKMSPSNSIPGKVSAFTQFTLSTEEVGMRLAADSTRHFDCSIDNMGGGFDLQRVVHPGLNRSDRDRTK